jgi:site-specific DNA recombinase
LPQTTEKLRKPLISSLSRTFAPEKAFIFCIKDNALIDMVITKSISRFARNTVTLLETVRMLKSIGVDVYFEEQGIHTIGGDGELMMTVLAGYAQEESKSVSDNMKWRIRRNFEEGKPWDGTLLGYRYKDGQYVIQPDEAETVRRIFELYLSGHGCASIGGTGILIPFSLV